ncbi:hypothetical protein AX16_002066 [Volvariella volvacea WC 439]|nr:hypothetical protein AX16_002066 [Volvariella volvacea WC 439]
MSTQKRPSPDSEGYYRISLGELPNTGGESSKSRPVDPGVASYFEAEFKGSSTHLPMHKNQYPPSQVGPGYDAERAQHPSDPFAASPSMPVPTLTKDPRPSQHRGKSDSWDFLGGLKEGYEGFDSRNATEKHLVFADGDMPNNRFSKLYHYLLNVSIITRWFLFIVPVLALLWIPGIVGLTTFPEAKIWGVNLLWWSIWLTVVWGGWWGALAFSLILPSVMRSTIGVVALASRRYIEWAAALHRYIALFGWSLAIWVSWNPLIDVQQRDASENSIKVIDLIGRLLFGLFICCAVLLAEKFAIQFIAAKFHERSYAERIADQKQAVKHLVTLYRHSQDLPGRPDTLEGPRDRRASMHPSKLLKRIRQGVRAAATTTTTALGNVASEIAGSSVLQPNSPQAMVKTALESANKSRLLARRLFHSFAKPGAEYLLIGDINKYFQDPIEAEQAFALFDKDGNGDASREEIEMACLDLHREQLSIEHSMRDLDSAVGRLDNILMSLYVIIVILILAVTLEAQLISLITGAGTLLLGLSWLIGGSLQEVLTSIIFLFVKHPFDVGDRVMVQKETYTVKEIRLLSTIFLDGHGTCIQAPNNILNQQFIHNYRRSPQMSETFTFDVNYGTTFEDIELLRKKMLAFLENERRDYHPMFDVSVVDFPNQEKMTLTADIKYKSNFQQGALKSKRRNKWVCALKTALAEVGIYGSNGNPNAPPGIERYTQVPWEVVRAQDEAASGDTPAYSPPGGWQLTDANAVILDPTQDVFGEANELHMAHPRRGLSEEQRNARSPFSNVSMPSPSTQSPGAAMPTPSASGSRPERIEMTPR